jgi:Fur family peroxide stress response transcriptional regulator
VRNPNRSHIEQRLETMTRTVKDAGIKLTPQRLEVFRVLAGSEEHPSAESVLHQVQGRMPTVSLDTVYRTLWMLHDLGLVTTLGPSSSGVRFDPNCSKHHHYVCVQCGLVRDFESKQLDGLVLPDAVRRFGTIKDAQVEVRGLCAQCQRNARKASKHNNNKLKKGSPR